MKRQVGRVAGGSNVRTPTIPPSWVAATHEFLAARGVARLHPRITARLSWLMARRIARAIELTTGEETSGGGLWLIYLTDALAHSPLDPIGGYERVLVLPHTERQPTRVPQSDVMATISRDIRSELLAPPLAVGGRLCRMNRTRVPEAPIDEYRHTGP